MAQKRTRVKAPYTPQELNLARADLHGAGIGRALNRLELEYTAPILKASGRGNIGLHSGVLRKLTDASSPGFNLLANPGDWLIIGGRWPIERNTNNSNYDRSHYATGTVNAGTPQTFTDATASVFTADDVGRWIFVYDGPNIGFYQIGAFIGATQVTLPNANFSTESNLLWGFVDPKDNWGTYEVDSGPSATECLIVDTSAFPVGTGGADSGLFWALYTPPKVTIASGFKFIHNSVIVEEDTNVDVNYPAGMLNPSTPIAFLYVETQDNREASPINYRIAYGHVPARNTVILATSVRDHTGQFSEWISTSEVSAEKNRALMEAFISSDPERGYLNNIPIIEMDMVQWPPRLTVKPRGVQNGGYHQVAPIITGAGLIEDRHLLPEPNILDVPVYPPISGDRIDKIAIRQREPASRELDTLEGVPATERPLSEGTLEYRTGISNLGWGAAVDHDGLAMKERISSLSPLDANTDSDHCLILANEYGVSLLAYTDDKVASPADGLKIRGYSKDGSINATPMVIPAQDAGISMVRGAVDANGWFWLCWIESIGGANELWGCVIDPYCGTQIVAASNISGADAVLATGSHGVCMSLMQQATFYWIETGNDFSRWLHTSHDGTGSFDNLGTEADITGNQADNLAVQYQWETGRVFVVEQHAGGGGDIEVYVKKNDYSALTDHNLSLFSVQGELDPGSLLRFFLVRDHKDHLYFICSGAILSSSNGSHLFAARIDGVEKRLHPITSKRQVAPFTTSNISISKDGKIIVCGLLDTDPFLVCFTERLQAVVETYTIFSPAAPLVPVGFSAAFVPRYGDVFCVAQYDDTVNKHFAFGIANVSADSNLPMGHYGFDPNSFMPDGDFELADVFIPQGALPDRPGLGMHLAPDAAPAGSTLAIDDATARQLTDSDPNTSIAVVANTSIGMMNTGDLRSIAIMDNVPSDGFNPAVDPLTVFRVWYSSDNTTWTQATVHEVYRVNGTTYLSFDQITAKYVKVNFGATLSVPREYMTPTNVVAANVVQMRCFSSRSSVMVHNLQDTDWFYMRGARIRYKNIPNYREIHVGDGVSSFGKYIGAEGIQKAIQEASKLSADSHRIRNFPRRKVTVKVGPGAYFMSKPMHFIAGVDIEFAKGAVLYDVSREETHNNIYSSGYVAAGYQIWEKTRTLYTTKCLHNYGIDVGSTVYITDGATSQLLKVAAVSPDGYQVHTDEVITLTSGAFSIAIYGKGMTIKGLNMVIERDASKIAGDLAQFSYIDGLRLEDINIINNTGTNAVSYSTLYVANCRNIYLDGNVESIDAQYSVQVFGCIGLRGGYFKASNDDGVAILISNCAEIRGFNSLYGQGDGNANNDIQLVNVVDSISVLGRIKTDNDLAGLGLNALGTDVDPDEFINLHIHRRGTVSILNNGIYEALISTSLTQIQAHHGTPSVLTPAGVIDGLVSDAIVDSLISS